MKNINKIIAAMLSATLCCSGMTLLSSAHDFTAEELLTKYESRFESDASTTTDQWRAVFDSTHSVYVDANGVIDENPDVVAILEQYRDTYPVMPGTLYSVTADNAAWCDPTTGAWLYFGTLSDSLYYRVQEDGTAKIIGCDYKTLSDAGVTALEIPAEIDRYVVTAIGQCAFDSITYNIPTLERIVLPDCIQTISDYAFDSAGCDVTIPSQVKMIGHFAYANLRDNFSGQMLLPDTLEFIDTCAFQYTLVTEYRLPSGKLIMGGRAGSRLMFKNDDWLPYEEDGKYLSFVEIENCVTSDEIDTFFVNKAAAKSLPTIAPNGDVNQSGTTEIGDAILLSRMVAEDASVTVSAEGIAAADVVTDGTLDGADITAILQIIANPNA